MVTVTLGDVLGHPPKQVNPFSKRILLQDVEYSNDRAFIFTSKGGFDERSAFGYRYA